MLVYVKKETKNQLKWNNKCLRLIYSYMDLILLFVFRLQKKIT